jgi:hydroxymethylbilane synthase
LAERVLLNELGGGCQVPIGAHAEVNGNDIKLIGVVARPDGSLVLRDTRHGSDPLTLGQELGKSLLERGGREILKEVYGESAVIAVQP